MKKERNHILTAGGYLTVYLALSLGILLSLYFALMQGARENTVRYRTVCAADIAGNSALGEYHRELQRQYDLFFIDTAYGSGAPSILNTEQHLKDYMNRNYEMTGLIGITKRRDFTAITAESVSVPQCRYIADGDFRPLRQQVYAYMAADPVEDAIAGALAGINQFQGLSLESGEWQRRRNDSERALEEARHASEGMTDENGEEVQIENPGEPVIAFRSTPILYQVIPNLDMVSQESIELSQVLSHRGLAFSGGYEPENTHDYPEVDALVFDEYILEKCGNYRETMKKSRLRYQVEYILAGKAEDEQNLEAIARRLMIIREAANCMYLFSDEGKKREAQILSLALACCLLNPELEKVITPVVLFAWAYLESVQDVKSLMAGGRVPLLKDASSWKIPLLSIFVPTIATRADSGGKGFSYQDYLRVFLFLEGRNLKTRRLLDMMEADIRKTAGNAGFMIDGCIDAFYMQAQVVDRSGYEYAIGREFGFN